VRAVVCGCMQVYGCGGYAWLSASVCGCVVVCECVPVCVSVWLSAGVSVGVCCDKQKCQIFSLLYFW
jgi:hypothetical protein